MWPMPQSTYCYWISNYKKNSKFNNSWILGLKLMKPPWFTHAHQGLSNNGRCSWKFSNWIWSNFYWQKCCSKSNNFGIACLNNTKSTYCHPSHQGTTNIFQGYDVVCEISPWQRKTQINQIKSSNSRMHLIIRHNIVLHIIHI